MVPDIPEWRDLRVEPAVTHETIRTAVRELHDRDDTDPDRIGLFGFSFGATQALIAAADLYRHIQHAGQFGISVTGAKSSTSR